MLDAVIKLELMLHVEDSTLTVFWTARTLAWALNPLLEAVMTFIVMLQVDKLMLISSNSMTNARLASVSVTVCILLFVNRPVDLKRDTTRSKERIHAIPELQLLVAAITLLDTTNVEAVTSTNALISTIFSCDGKVRGEVEGCNSFVVFVWVAIYRVVPQPHDRPLPERHSF